MLMLATGSATFAAARPNNSDIRVLVDVSGSMKKNDPKNLRAPAVRLLASLLPEDTQSGVWSFARYVNMLVPLKKVNTSWKKLAEVGSTQIHSRGLFTNIEAALNHASQGWSIKDQRYQRNIILLTDGVVDISKDPKVNKVSRAKIIKQIIPRLKNLNVQVHTIALSEESDIDLLKRLALDTDGSFRLVETAADLQRVFLHLFEKTTVPDTIPINGNQFVIDSAIREATLLIFRDPDSDETLLVAPNGKTVTRNIDYKNVKWRRDEGYDLITITNPPKGTWKIHADMDQDNRVMIVTDLKLKVTHLPNYFLPNQVVAIKSLLTEQNETIKRKDFLDLVKMQTTQFQPDSKTVPHDMNDDGQGADKKKNNGIFTGLIIGDHPEGTHELIITANSGTFTRTKRLTFTAQWPVESILKPDSNAGPGTYILTVNAREEYIKSETLTLSGSLELPDKSQVPLKFTALDNTEGQWIANVSATSMSGLHLAQIGINAETLKGEKINIELTPIAMLGDPTAPAPPKEESDDESPAPVAVATDADIEPEAIEPIKEEQDKITEPEEDHIWASTGFIIGMVNFLLALIGGALYWFVFRKKSSDEFNLDADDEEPKKEDTPKEADAPSPSATRSDANIMPEEDEDIAEKGKDKK